jgi:predicted nuclease with TOPRIM domain
MSVTGLEKFEHLEDKIRLAVEMCKTLKQEKEQLEEELKRVNERLAESNFENSRLKSQIERLLTERDATRRRVEEMLHEIATLEMEAESLKR